MVALVPFSELEATIWEIIGVPPDTTFCVEVPSVYVEFIVVDVCPKVMGECKNTIATTTNIVAANIFNVCMFLIKV